MDKKYKDLLKNTSILTISSFSSKVLVFLLVPLYTNVLSTEEYGIYDLIMSTVQLIMPFLTFNIADGVLRYMMDEETDTIAIRTIGLKYISTACIYAALLLILNHFLNLWDSLRQYEYYVYAYFVFYIFNQLFAQAAKGIGDIRDIAIAGVLSTIITLGGNITFLLLWPMGLKGFFLSYILGQGVPAFYLCLKTNYFHFLSFKIDRELQSEMLGYSLPLIMTTLGWWVNNVSDRYAVTWMCGFSNNGIYSVAYKIPTIITTVQNVFIQAWTLSAIREYGKNGSENFFKRMFWILNAIMILCCSVLIVIVKPLARFLFAKEFYQAWIYVPFLLISCIPNAASGFIGPILSAQKNSKAMARSAVYGAFANIILNFILVYLWGPQGAAVATAISSLIIFLARRRAVGNILCSGKDYKIMISWVFLVFQGILMVVGGSWKLQMLVFVVQLLIYKELFVNMVKLKY